LWVDFSWDTCRVSAREMVLAAESKAGGQSLPVVNVSTVTRSSAKTSLVLPGNIQAVTEGPVLARGQRLHPEALCGYRRPGQGGQVPRQIEAPDWDSRSKQAQAAIDQAQQYPAGRSGAAAGTQQREPRAPDGRSAGQSCFSVEWVSRQDNDTTQAQYDAQRPTYRPSKKSRGRRAAAARAPRKRTWRA